MKFTDDNQEYIRVMKYRMETLQNEIAEREEELQRIAESLMEATKTIETI